MAVSIHHAIKIMKSKYNNARNIYVLNYATLKENQIKPVGTYLFRGKNGLINEGFQQTEFVINANAQE